MEANFSQLFCEIFQKNALERFCTPEIITRFQQFTELLIEENSHTNLTAIRQVPDIIAKHYADSLLAEELFSQGATVLDVGCGGGFPTFPLAIVRPDLRITALDSTQKKINFVAKAAKKLKLTNITPICARAEDPELRKFRERFDVVTSRAMARMNILTELSLPFVKINGLLIALKGIQGDIEATEAEKAIHTLGGAFTKDHLASLTTQSEQETRHILVVSKRSPSPKQYPRAYATICKKPL